MINRIHCCEEVFLKDMSEEKESHSQDKTEEELATLLDSKMFHYWIHLSKCLFKGALEDFIAEDKKPKTETKIEDESSNSVVLNSQEWSKDFVQQAASQFEGQFADFLAGLNPHAEVTPDLLQQRLQQMAGN